MAITLASWALGATALVTLAFTVALTIADWLMDWWEKRR